MIAPLAKFIDWSVLQFWWAIRLRSVRKWNLSAASSKLEEALRFLNGPDFIPAESQPARVEFNPDKPGPHFHFPTPRPCDFAENNTVDGRLYRCAEHWQEHPAIILLHGGGDFLNHRFRFPWIVPDCNRAGFNAATVVAPYHFQRRARGLADWTHLQTAHAFAQAVGEIRALTGWLLGEGCPCVALWGFSLGGWFAGLAASCDTRIASVVLAAPGVRMDYKFSRAERVIWRRVREALGSQSAARAALDTTPLNLIRSRPVIPKEHILLIEGRHDLFVETEATEELWQAWGQPEIWRLPHGHISLALLPGLTARVLEWLAPRLDASFSHGEII
jgi:pimeloyl-ACP methyl ester carboxylesterase